MSESASEDGNSSDNPSEESGNDALFVDSDLDGSSGEDEEFVGCDSKTASEASDLYESSEGGDGDMVNGQESDESEPEEEDKPRCYTCQRVFKASVMAGQPLFCDGGCERELPATELIFSCVPCDFDICTACAGWSRRRHASVAVPPFPPVASVPPPAALSATPTEATAASCSRQPRAGPLRTHRAASAATAYTPAPRCRQRGIRAVLGAPCCREAR